MVQHAIIMSEAYIPSPAEFLEIGFVYPNATRPVACEAGHKVLGLTHANIKGHQVYRFASLEEFNLYRRDVMESVGRHGVNIPVPIVSVQRGLDVDRWVISNESHDWLKKATRLGAEFQNSGLTVEVHGQFGQIGIAMQDRERGVPIMWFRDVYHFNASASDVWEVRRGANEVPIPVVEIPAEWPEGMEPVKDINIEVTEKDGATTFIQVPFTEDQKKQLSAYAEQKGIVPTPGIPAFPEGGFKAEPETEPVVDLADTDQPQEVDEWKDDKNDYQAPPEEPESPAAESDLAKSVVEYVQNATEKVRITAIARDLGVEKDAIKALLELDHPPIKQNAAGVITLNR